MSALHALLLATTISLIIGGLLFGAVRLPLERLLQQACPGDAAANFWARFTLVMLVLAPLFIAVAFGLPPAEMSVKSDPASIVSRIITASVCGAFLAMLGMGFWVSTLARRSPALPVNSARPDPVERWGTK